MSIRTDREHERTTHFLCEIGSGGRLFRYIPMMANLKPWFSDNKWFKRVVFPAPRKPVNTVTGTFPSSPYDDAIADMLKVVMVKNS